MCLHACVKFKLNCTVHTYNLFLHHSLRAGLETEVTTCSNVDHPWKLWSIIFGLVDNLLTAIKIAIDIPHDWQVLSIYTTWLCLSLT